MFCCNKFCIFDVGNMLLYSFLDSMFVFDLRILFLDYIYGFDFGIRFVYSICGF